MVRKVCLVDCLKQSKRWPFLSEMEMLELGWCTIQEGSKNLLRLEYWSGFVVKHLLALLGGIQYSSYPTAIRHLQEEPGVLESAGHCSL